MIEVCQSEEINNKLFYFCFNFIKYFAGEMIISKILVKTEIKWIHLDGTGLITH